MFARVPCWNAGSGNTVWASCLLGHYIKFSLANICPRSANHFLLCLHIRGQYGTIKPVCWWDASLYWYIIVFRWGFSDSDYNFDMVFSCELWYTDVIPSLIYTSHMAVFIQMHQCNNFLVTVGLLWRAFHCFVLMFCLMFTGFLPVSCFFLRSISPPACRVCEVVVFKGFILCPHWRRKGLPCCQGQKASEPRSGQPWKVHYKSPVWYTSLYGTECVSQETRNG